jgi:putative PIN family toxin of toxin-antitoxin system
LGKKKVTGPAKPGNRGRPAKPRVVLDTNVLVSALLFFGPPNKLVTLWQEGRIVLLISKEVLVEYLRVLSYPKFGLTQAEIKALIAESVLPYVETVTVGTHPPVISEDPADDKFLFLADDGHARYIVSGDKHLLSLEKYRGIEILPARSFLESFQ